MSARRRRIVAAIAAVLTALSVAALPAAAAEPWQASNAFYIASQELPGFDDNAFRAYYRLEDEEGNQLRPLIERLPEQLLGGLEVPLVPGAYTLEGWLVDAAGRELRRATAILRFDNVAPPPPEPADPARWLLATEPALLQIGHPAPPLPVSGLRGYAISLDRGAGSSPCPESGICTVAATDLAGGIDDDTISLGTLPEGVTYARVASVSGAGIASAARTVAFRVDGTLPQVSLLGLPGGWSADPVQLTVRAVDSLSGMAAAGPTGPFTALAVDGRAPTVAAGDRSTAWVGGDGVHTVAYFARDAAGNVADGSPGAASPQTARVLIDETPPRIEFAPAQDPGDPERIEASVKDALSGPSPSRGAIAIRRAGTHASFEQLPTRVDGNRLVARWDSDGYPGGKYELLATGFDVAGNAGRGTDRARGGRMVLVNPVKAPVQLTAKLERLRLSGRLRRVGGGTLAGQEILVTETFVQGAAPAGRTTVVRTGPDGTFSLPLEEGPSREVAVSFDGTRLLGRATAPPAHLAAKTQLRFQASATSAVVGGRPIVFSGRVETKGTRAAARAALPVVLQFRYRGAPWSEFRTVEADAHGRFRYAYRFSDDDSRGVRFQFRAYVKGREGWPYGPSASRPVTVTGR